MQAAGSDEEPAAAERAPSVEESGDMDGIVDPATGLMRPDHPLLARAQEALRVQLTESKLRVEGELREKSKLLGDAMKKREHLGVDLFGFQQQLAKLQMDLEKAHDRHTQIAARKEEADTRLHSLKALHDEKGKLTADERVRADKFQQELDRQAATLRSIEEYNREMKNEIAVTRRATYKAEESVQALEKEKRRQDNVIEVLQDTLKGLHQQAALYAAQIDAQKRETRAAMETLVEAEKEMESIHFEKRQLVAQWQSSLLAISRRVKALSALKAALHEQQEQELSIMNELGRFKKDIREQQVRHENLTSVMLRLEGDMETVTKSIEVMRDKQNHLNETFSKLDKALEATNAKLARCDMESKAIDKELVAMDKAFTKTGQDNMNTEASVLAILSDQTTLEKGGGRTAAVIQRLRRTAREKELQVVSIQNEAAKLRVDVLNTEAHNERLDDTLKLLEQELDEKAGVIDRYETEMRRRNDEIEKKTRTVDLLNRKLEKITSTMVDGEETGPLEATVQNLSREIQRKGLEGNDMQRRWINLQTELVAKQIDNAKLSEAQGRLTADFSIQFQRKVRLEQELEREAKQVQEIDRHMSRLHQDMVRINRLISKNSDQAVQLTDENFTMEREIMSELKGMESEAIRLETAIDDATAAKKAILAGILDCEGEILIWERKIQLEKEMQAILDPTVGQDVIGSMKIEIHRMELRKRELETIKEQLMSELERSISKRDTIATNGRARLSNSKKQGALLTEQQLAKKCAELQRSVADTEGECGATDARIRSMDAQRTEMADEMEALAGACMDLRHTDVQVRAEVNTLLTERTGALLRTSRMQAAARALEEAVAGRYTPAVENFGNLEAELTSARQRHAAIAAAVNALASQSVDLAPSLERVLLHIPAVEILAT